MLNSRVALLRVAPTMGRRLYTRHSALFDFIKNGDAEGAGKFIKKLERHGENAIKLAVNSRDENNFTPVMACVSEISERTAAKKAPTKSTSLKKEGRRQILKMLIDEGADMNATDDWGRGVSHIAAVNGDVQALMILAESAPHMSFDLTDNDGFKASDYSHDEDLDKLLNTEPKSVVIDKLRARFNPPKSKLREAKSLEDLGLGSSVGKEADEGSEDRAGRTIDDLTDDLSEEMKGCVIKGLEHDVPHLTRKQLRSVDDVLSITPLLDPYEVLERDLCEEKSDTIGTISAKEADEALTERPLRRRRKDKDAP